MHCSRIKARIRQFNIDVADDEGSVKCDHDPFSRQEANTQSIYYSYATSATAVDSVVCRRLTCFVGYLQECRQPVSVLKFSNGRDLKIAFGIED
jgi:hypothetical protein